VICPKCAHEKTRVINTEKTTQVIRFRRCEKCKHTFQTVEAIKFDNYWRLYAKATYDENTQGKKQTKPKD